MLRRVMLCSSPSHCVPSTQSIGLTHVHNPLPAHLSAQLHPGPGQLFLALSHHDNPRIVRESRGRRASCAVGPRLPGPSFPSRCALRTRE